jgi:hypothetical protein
MNATLKIQVSSHSALSSSDNKGIIVPLKEKKTESS